MGRLRFVKPEVDRYDISDGDWIEITRDLNVEEEKFLQTAGLRHMSNVQPGDQASTHIDVNWQAYGLARAITYLKAWSFRSADDRPVPCTADAIGALDPDTFEEIENVITAHRERRAQEKKVLTTTRTGETSSSSPNGSDAASTTSS